tara:strand:- start:7559 stop:7795 length:237 start_codon:yes stop_codon:yes gene_type:complete
MTTHDINAVLAETESRFRQRTPATRADEALASYRVGRSEMRRWCLDNGVALDEFCPDFIAASEKLFHRLRREFKTDRW